MDETTKAPRIVLEKKSEPKKTVHFKNIAYLAWTIENIAISVFW